MGILLGNLTVKQIEERLGIELTNEERQFFIDTKQERAENVDENRWHCFDIPFNMICGSMEFATKVYEMLKPYSDKMNESLQISIDKS